MIRLSEIIKELELVAPSELKFEWDNVGLLVGDEGQKINKAFLCLDITSENVRSAIECGSDLIVSHHPLIFEPLKAVTDSDLTGSIVRTLIQNNISAVCIHTSFDVADGGMNDLLAHKLNLKDIRRLAPSEFGNPNTLGRMGSLEVPMTMAQLLEYVKNSLSCTALKYAGDPSDIIHTVAVCSGSGGSEMYAAYHSGADAYVTGDLKHDHGRIASEIGLNIIDAGHFETENIICEFLADLFARKFPEIDAECSTAKPYFKAF